MRDSIERRDSGIEEPAEIRSRQLGPLHFRTVFVGTRPPSRLRLLALAIGALIIGGAFVALGLLLLAALVTSGALVGAGYLLYRRMRRALGGRTGTHRELDPRMEIKATEASESPTSSLPRDRNA